ncbi:MAG TPA: helix-turn-helix domain-containing protein [Stellaceae bacterium]|jgi:AcrR family transcriptional regulator
MARARPTPGGGAQKSDSDRIIDAALAAIEAQGWRRLSLAAIAAEAGLPILQLYRMFPSKVAILCGLLHRVDETVLAAPLEMPADERPRDRVFDLLMRRFDALCPHKGALEVLRRELPSDPPAALAAAHAGLRSMRWMLEAAGIATGGIGGIIAVKLTAAAYFQASRTWLRDDSPDLAQTMAVLDQRLRGIERWYGHPRRRRAEEPASA